MFEALKARTRAVAANRRNVAAGGKATRGKAAVTFAARLTFEDVSRRFGERLALDHVSLDIEPGEVICLLGPSGCGKTTLLRIAAGGRRCAWATAWLCCARAGSCRPARRSIYTARRRTSSPRAPSPT